MRPVEVGPSVIRRITLESFMAHRRTVLEPAPGLTVLAGPNNCGKSAVVEALRVLCRNGRGDFMVRHGESSCRVVVETDDGHVLEWRRKGPTVSYRLDGEDVHRLRGGVPEKLHELLRLPLVGEGDDACEIHLAEQKSPIFLLDEPGSRAATFFASSSDAAHLLEMQRRHRRKVAASRFEDAHLAKREADLDRRLESLEPLAPLDERLTETEATHAALLAATERAERLGREIRALDRRRRETTRLEALARTLRPLPAPPAQHDRTAVASLLHAIGTARDRMRRARGRHAVLAGLPAAPEQHEDAALAKHLARLRAASRRVDALSRTVARLAELAGPPALEDPAPLEEVRSRLVATQASVDERRRGIAKLSRERTSVTKAVRTWAEDHPTCPTCGGDVVAERLLEIERGGDDGRA
jgi:DNA repair exonuclease SbcCD ATPase subunit